jgi:hypothetical protein
MQFPGVHYPVSSVPLILLWTLFVASAKGCLLAAVLSPVARGGKGLHPEFRHALRLIGVYGFAFFFLASFLFPTIHVELGWPRVDGKLLERAVWKTLGGVFYREAVPASPGAAGAAPDAGGGMAGGTPVFDWQAAAFLVWVAGIFASSIKVAAGEASLRALARGARKPQPKRCRQILARLAGVMGVGSEVTLLLSAQCRIPFTYRLRGPVIVLPPDAALWPVERLKAVLAHELGHIKRGDFLTQLAARAVCSLFWFAPPVWLGYRSLCAEQESACDEMVVAAGVKGPAYAECILDLARLATGRASAAGLHFSKGSLRSLEARIRVILGLGAGRRAGDAKENGPPPAPAPRAARPLQAGLVALFSALVLLAAVADKVELAAAPASGIKVDPTSGRQYYVPGPNEELYGTWISLEYSGFSSGYCQKMVFDDWGFAYNYLRITDTTSLDRWTSTIVDKWTDSEGGVWYREFEQCPGFYTCLQLIRIREGGELLEWVYNFTRFPVESDLNPDNITYRTYRRGS